MGSEFSFLISGGGRDTEASNEEYTKRQEHDLRTPQTLYADIEDSTLPKPPHLNDAMRPVDDNAGGAHPLRPMTTASMYPTHAPVLMETKSDLYQLHVAAGTSTKDMTHAIISAPTVLQLPTTAAVPSTPHPQQLLRRTQYSMYAQQMRRRSDETSLRKQHTLNSDIDFMVANEFFNRSDSSLGSDANLDSGSENNVHENSSNDDKIPKGFIEIHRSDRPPGHHRPRDPLAKHPAECEESVVDGEPTPLCSPEASLDHIFLSPMRLQPSCAVGEELPRRVTPSPKGSSVEDGAAPSSPAPQHLRWPKLREPSTYPRNGSRTHNAAIPCASATAVHLLSSYEEQKSVARRKDMRKRECKPGEAAIAVALASSVADWRTTTTTTTTTTSNDVAHSSVGIELPIARMSLRSPVTEKLDGAAGNVSEMGQPVLLCTAVHLPCSTTSTKMDHKNRRGCGDEYKSVLPPSISPAPGHSTSSEDGECYGGVECGPRSPSSSHSSLGESGCIVWHRTGSCFAPSSRSDPHSPGARGYGRGRYNDDKSAPERESSRLGTSTNHPHHHYDHPMHAGSPSGLCDSSSDASTEQREHGHMLYGSSDDLWSASRSPTASLQKTEHMETGDYGAMACTLGSLFSDSQSNSPNQISISSGIAWMGDYMDGWLQELTTTAVEPGVQATEETDDSTSEAVQPDCSDGWRHESSLTLMSEEGMFGETCQPLQADLQHTSPSHPQQPARTPPRVCVSPSLSSDSDHQPRIAIPVGSSGVDAVSSSGSPRRAVGVATEDDDTAIPLRREGSDFQMAPPPCNPPSVPAWRRYTHDHIRATERVSLRNSDYSINGMGGGRPVVCFSYTEEPTRVTAPTEVARPSSFPHPPTSEHTGVTRAERRGPQRQREGRASAARVSAALEASGSALRLTRADSKDFILRPNRSPSAHRHRGDGGAVAVDYIDGVAKSASRTRSPRNRRPCSEVGVASFSSSSGSLAKAAAGATSSIERRRRTTCSGGSGSNRAQAQAHYHNHSDDGSTVSTVPQSASSRKGEVNGCHSPGRNGHISVGVSTTSRGKREKCSRHRFRGKGRGEGKICGLMSGNNSNLGPDSRPSLGNMTTAPQPCISSSSSFSSLAPLLPSGSATGGVGSDSVRALRRKAAKVRDLSTSSSVESDANGRHHSHSTLLHQHPPPHEASAMPTGASSIGRLSRLITSNSSATNRGPRGSTNGAKLLSRKASMGGETSSNDVSTSRPASTFSHNAPGDANIHQPRLSVSTPQDLAANGLASVRSHPRLPLWTPTTMVSATTPTAPSGLPVVVKNQSMSLRFANASDGDMSLPSRASGHENLSRRPSMVTSIPGAHLYESEEGGGGATTAVPAALSSAASLFAGTPRDSSTKRRRPTTQTFTPWTVDMRRLTELKGGAENPTDLA